jgi:hypothetical protein
VDGLIMQYQDAFRCNGTIELPALERHYPQEVLGCAALFRSWGVSGWPDWGVDSMQVLSTQEVQQVIGLEG